MLSDKPPRKKLILFCYMRGGSTFLSSFFKKNPDVLFWYEPFAAFYKAHYATRSWIYPQDVFWSQVNNTTRIEARYGVMIHYL